MSKNLKKIYRPAFRRQSGAGIILCKLFCGRRRICGDHGESGPGKTTLLNIMAALDKPTEGTVLLDGKPLSSIKTKISHSFGATILDLFFRNLTCWIRLM